MSRPPIYHIMRRRARRNAAQMRSAETRLGRAGISFLAIGVMASLLLVVVGGGVFALRADQYPGNQLLHAYLGPEQGLLLEPSVFYDRTGETELYRLAPPTVERGFLAYEDFSPALVKVSVAANDPGFWSGFGYQNDTIPSVIVERFLIPTEAENPIIRYWLISSLLYAEGKEQILAWYLNSNTYGMNTIGVEQAAQLYLGKSAADLTLAEAALLTAVQQAPALNPFDALSAALENKDLLLLDLQNQDVISDEEYQDALAEVINVQPALVSHVPSGFIQQAIDTLAQEISPEQLLLGGYRIITTLDADLQRQSECVIAEQLRRVNDPAYQIDPSMLDSCQAARFLAVLPPEEERADFLAAGSTILLDPRTSQVLAFVEQSDVTENVVRIAQQPGTSLAPFVALTGFSHGESPATLRWDIPGSVPEELVPYLENDQSFDGPMRSREAILREDALVLAEWMMELGEQDVLRFARTAGLSSLAEAGSAAQLLFEGGDLSLIEQAAAYAVFANAGVVHGVKTGIEQQLTPQLILNVFNPDDELMLLHCTSTASQTLVGSDLAYLVHDVLSDEVLRRQNLGFPNSFSIGHPVGGLLPSSDGEQQRWALGYTPQLVGGVWIGSEQGNPLPVKSAGNVWYALMTYALQGKPVEGWEKPENIITMTVCSPSGLLPTTACQQLVTETFIQGNQPVQLDNLYQIFTVNRETGRLATVFTPLALVDERIFLVVPPEAQTWAQENGLPVPPADYDTIQQAQSSPDVNFTFPSNFSYISGEVTLRGTAAGDGFRSYTIQVGEGLNPTRWTVIHEESAQAVKSGILGTWNTQGYEGLYVLRLVVEQEGQQLESALLQVTVDNTPPSAVILSPVEGEALPRSVQGEVVFQVQPEDNLGIAEVRWWIDGEMVASRQFAPYTAYVVLQPGEYSLVVEVIDQAGNQIGLTAQIFTVED